MGRQKRKQNSSYTNSKTMTSLSSRLISSESEEVMKRYYFDTESSAPDSVCDDHCGNIRGARTIAQKVANELNEVVYINDCETNDIVDCIEPDYILD